jgi:hypothetical protein
MNFCYSHRQNYSYLFQLIGAVALALWAQPTAAYAQRISATARVQETNINVGAFTGGFNRGSGTSIAGAQVFNPRATSMTVSDSAAMTDRAANASEAPLIQRALDALSAIPGAPDKLSSKPYVDAFKSATNAIVPKPNAVPPAFPEVKKAKNDVLQAQASIGNPAVQESGLATAMQTVSADGETEKFSVACCLAGGT